MSECIREHVTFVTPARPPLTQQHQDHSYLSSSSFSLLLGKYSFPYIAASSIPFSCLRLSAFMPSSSCCLLVLSQFVAGHIVVVVVVVVVTGIVEKERERLELEVLGVYFPQPFLLLLLLLRYLQLCSTGSEVQETSAHAALYTCYSDHKTKAEEKPSTCPSQYALYFKARPGRRRRRRRPPR